MVEVLKSFVGESRIWIYGYGVEGQSSFRFFKSHGFDVGVIDGNSELIVEDASRIILGQDVSAFFFRCDSHDLIIRSAGISPLKPELQQALKCGARISSQLNIFALLCPLRVVAVTGTMGKGTTCSILKHLCDASGVRTQIGGNFGLAMLDLISQLDELDFVILELSSFQLMDFAGRGEGRGGFDVSIFLRTTSEHLDWHANQEEYLWAKTQLTSKQSTEQFLIVNADSPHAVSMAQDSLAKVVSFGNNEVGSNLDLGLKAHYEIDELNSPIHFDSGVYFLKDGLLLGSHQRENLSAAYLAARLMNVDSSEAIDAMKTFPGLDMRTQVVANQAGVRFINDSYATSPDATIAAINMVQEEPLALILGGSEKYADFDQLAEAISVHRSLKIIILIGVTSARLKSLISGRDSVNSLVIKEAKSLSEACELGVEGLGLGEESEVESIIGGTLLLSPACASFGWFKNYKDRGAQFNIGVKNFVESNRF